MRYLVWLIAAPVLCAAAMLVVFAGGIGIAIYCVMLRGRGRWF